MGEAEGGDPPGRRGSLSVLRETPPHSAAHPPSRGRQLRSCFSTAGRRAAVSPRWALVKRPSPAPPIPRPLLFAGRALLERVQWLRERGADPPPAALSCALDDTAPASTPRAGKGGGWEAGRWIRGEGPGGTGSQGAEWKSKAYAVAGGAPTEIENSKRGPTGPTGLAGPAQASSPARAAWTEGK